MVKCPARISLFITACSFLRYDVLGFHSGGDPGAASRTALNVLSPRQLQFWEDVEGKEICSSHRETNDSKCQRCIHSSNEDGLVDVENFYGDRGQSMHRIRKFCER